MSTLRETFFEELAEVHDAGKQLVKALPKMAKTAQHEQLRHELEEYLEETEEQLTRLEHVFEVLNEKVERSPCQPMLALLTGAEQQMEQEAGDAALICTVQKTAHYQIAAYGCLQTWARLLGEEDAADLLEETLDQAEAADERLTETTEEIINLEEERSS